jgi:hypothetical protein
MQALVRDHLDRSVAEAGMLTLPANVGQAPVGYRVLAFVHDALRAKAMKRLC